MIIAQWLLSRHKCSIDLWSFGKGFEDKNVEHGSVFMYDTKRWQWIILFSKVVTSQVFCFDCHCQFTDCLYVNFCWNFYLIFNYLISFFGYLWCSCNCEKQCLFSVYVKRARSKVLIVRAPKCKQEVPAGFDCHFLLFWVISDSTFLFHL